MPIRPIDIITMAPKSQEVTSYKHAEDQKPIREQLQINQNFQQTVEHNSQKTVAMSGGDALNFTYDAKEKGNNEYQKKNKKITPKKREASKDGTKQTGIDIRI